MVGFFRLAAPQQAVILMLVSAASFSGMAYIVKVCASLGVPLMLIIASRSLISLVLCLVDLKKRNISPFGRHKTLLLFRGFLGFLAIAAIFYSLSLAPLGLVTILDLMYPAFAIVFSYFFLNETITKGNIFCLTLSALGIFFTFYNLEFSSNGQYEMLVIGILIGIAGAIFNSLSCITIKVLCDKEDAMVIVFYFPFVAFPISLFIALQSQFSIDLKILCYLVLIGILTQIGQVTLTKAYQKESVANASLLSYTEILFSFILGVLFLNEVPSIFTVLGAVCICAGAYMNVKFKQPVSKFQRKLTAIS